MSFRVTLSSSSRSVLANLRTASDRVATAQEQLSSGLRINRPSDAPLDAAQAERLQANKAQLDQYASNATQAQSQVDFAASTVQGFSDLLIQAREACTQGANASMSAADRLTLADSVDKLLQSAVDGANTQFNGRYLFAGTATATQPFQTQLGSSGSIESVTYQGNDGRIQVDVGPRARVQTNEPGSTILGASGTAGSVFDALIQLRDTLRNDAGKSDSQVSAELSSQLTGLGAAQDRVLGATASLGSRSNQIQATSAALSNAQLANTQLLSHLQDADMAGAATAFYGQETALQAAMIAATKMFGTSLFNYIQ